MFSIFGLQIDTVCIAVPLKCLEDVLFQTLIILRQNQPLFLWSYGYGLFQKTNVWYLLNLLIHQTVRCLCPSLTSPPCSHGLHFSLCASPLKPNFSPYSNEYISAHPQRVLLSVWALKNVPHSTFPSPPSFLSLPSTFFPAFHPFSCLSSLPL